MENGTGPWVVWSSDGVEVLSYMTHSYHHVGKPSPGEIVLFRLWHASEKEMATHSSVLGLENPRDGGAWWAAVSGVAQSRT